MKPIVPASLGVLILLHPPPALAQGWIPEPRLELPPATAPARKDAVTVMIARDGRLAVGDRAIGDSDLVAAVSSRSRGKDVAIIIRADRAGSFERVKRVMTMLRDAGFNKIALVSEPPAN